MIQHIQYIIHYTNIFFKMVYIETNKTVFGDVLGAAHIQIVRKVYEISIILLFDLLNSYLK